MCGIAGIVYFDGRKVEHTMLQRMTDVIRHRGPDGEGHWYNEEMNVGFGHRRLAIIDLSAAANQPMIYNERLVITLNGEIYNYKELKVDLVKKGYVFYTHSDTEVLLAMYQEYKEKCLTYLDGMFAFCIYDTKGKSLFCARDRFGEKPFYYHFKRDHSFYFASEVKAILSTGIPFNENLRMIYYYLAYSVVENALNKEETFFEEIVSLEPAHYLLIDNKGTIRKEKYWDIENHIFNPPPSPAEAAEQVKELVQASVNFRLRSDVSVGSSLSGGMDSSIIVTTISDILKGQNVPAQNTFSARFDDPQKDEGHYIRKMIDTVHVKNQETFVSGEHFRQDYEKILWHQEEPIGGASPVAQWEVMKLASSAGVTVLLDGQGADEVFAGYHHYFTPYLTELYLNDRKTFIEEKKAFENLHHAKFSVNGTFYLETYLPEFLRTLGYYRRKFGIPSYLGDLNPDFAHLFKTLPPPFKNFRSLNLSLRYSTINYGLGKLLKLADRNAMAFGREVRLPYLYHPLVEYIFKLPANYKINNGWTKWILRRAFEEKLPEEIIWRKDKLGYEPPMEKWMATAWISDNVHHAVQELKKMGILSKPRKEKEWFYLNVFNFLRIFKNQINTIG